MSTGPCLRRFPGRISDQPVAATATLRVVDRVRAWPTFLFVDRAGAIRAIYTGFSGPATGDAFAAQHASFVRGIERLLDDRS